MKMYHFWPSFLILTNFYHQRVEAYCWQNLEFLESPLVKQIGKIKDALK